MNEEYKETQNVYLELYKYLNNKKVMINSYEIIKKMNELTKLLEKTLRETCDHEYEYDDIDISLDKSQRICYCKRCMLTF
jgi:hypothetical protein